MNHETVQKIIAREKFATFSARAEGRWGGGGVANRPPGYESESDRLSSISGGEKN